VFETSLVAYRSSTELLYNTQTEEFLFEDNCREFLSDVKMDRTWRIVVGLQLSCWIMAVILSLFLLVSSCCRYSKSGYRSIGILWLVTCCPASGLFFLLMAHGDLCKDNPVIRELLSHNNTGSDQPYEHECKLGRGGIVYIMGVAGFFVTGVATLCLSLGSSSSDKDTKSICEQSSVKESPSVSVHVVHQGYTPNTDAGSVKSGGSKRSISGSVSDDGGSSRAGRTSSTADMNYDDNPFASSK
jgi:hypothetical protein